MAGITRPLEDTILDQFTYLYSLADTMTEQQKTELETLKVKVARLKDPELSKDISPQDLPLGIPVAYWLDLRDHSTLDAAKTLNMPILVIQGERDYQVLETKDFKSWKTALNKENASFKLFPKLNHLFIAGDGKSTPQEYMVEGRIRKRGNKFNCPVDRKNIVLVFENILLSYPLHTLKIKRRVI